jgi:hypothetical protein
VGAFLLANVHHKESIMKGGQNFREMQSKKKEKEDAQWIHQPICCVCGRKCEGYYGRWGDSGSCNSACEKVQLAKPRYPGHSESEFLNRLGECDDARIDLQPHADERTDTSSILSCGVHVEVE